MQSRLADPKGGGYFLAEADPNSPMARPRDTADGALPSANGVAVQVLAALARRSGEMRFEERAEAQLSALSGTIQRDPASHATLLVAMQRLRTGETGSLQYAARGAVRVSARAVAQGANGARVELTLSIKPGWHINARQPLQDDLVPTTLKPATADWRVVRIDYPQAEVVKLGFQKQALALYQGDATVRAELQRKAATTDDVVPLELRLQSCSDRVCLPPETLRLEVRSR
ncbi:MAG: protein-disulfide reductase DsbD family protein [Thiobacillus sp.]|nr:protein-disulfide reductase DsbD family protein [Thiobacillus sp.]